MKNIFILLCVFMLIAVIAEVYIDPYRYWYTGPKDQERYEQDLLLEQYYSNYFNEPDKPRLKQGTILVYGDCYNNQSIANRELQRP